MNPALAIVLKRKLAASLWTIELHNEEILRHRKQALAALQHAKEAHEQIRHWRVNASKEEQEEFGRLCDAHGFAVFDVLPEVL